MATATLEKPASDATPGYFGQFGGTFVPETLVHALAELEAELARPG